MWQAELHLMLSEPQKALPFELQAYKYLKLAKQSERIYVQRLGFEPPPVSEQRRLTGELDDVESYQNIGQSEFNDSDELLFSQVFTLLSLNTLKQFSPQQQQLIKRLKQRFSELAQHRPALISYVLLMEKMLLANNNQPQDCDNCSQKLSAKLWQLISTPAMGPQRRQSEYLANDELVKKYMGARP